MNYSLKDLDLVDKPNIVSRFEELFRQMWVNNGNELAKMYAGTGALTGGSKVCKVFTIFFDSFQFKLANSTIKSPFLRPSDNKFKFVT